ncbi:dolichyl-diphosphooligosaccharide--protein glycosyltransferase subunit STT3 [Methanococcus aeolicus]|uniref:dolichyl-diphosphooligosaccharide--protein glycosyltransferase subunit STT3 n=1 Tax=Methanococcus aeolicus TaxID=42879 RepID=UPI0021C610EF|nr:dolichyl-diphosphooligosaccharide--protein glycosyltransferase subunit STT3 [Methanococcus aeolicus]UXM84982.1 dolichyl-diphosphooligosaccharide--protein glycosyltransferase subunit STT3 [Methanococcus aeolicus]
MEQIKKIAKFINNHSYLKTILIVLVIALMSFQLRAQPADMGFTDNQQLKEMFADENGRMYLIALDPYYYLRLAENYNNNGHLGETLKEINGEKVPYDTIQYAPPGHSAPKDVPTITMVTLAVYDIWHSFDSTVSIMNAAYWVPALLSMLLGAPVFFMIRRITQSNIGGIVGATIISTSPALLYKTSAGFADTPIFEVLPILFIIWFIMEAIHNQNNLKKSLIFASLATIAMALATKMWAGWWYGYYISAGFLLIYSIYSIIIKKYDIKSIVKAENIKSILSIAGIFIIGSALLISLLYGVDTLIGGIMSPIGQQAALTTTEHASGWPNVYTTVAELNKVDMNTIIGSSAGSKYLFVAGIIGVLASFVSMRYRGKKEDNIIKFDVKYALILAIWLAITFYAATKGNRFIGLMVPPLSIGIGVFAGQLDNIIKIRNDDLTKWILYPIIGLLGLISIIGIKSEILNILLPTTYVPIAAYGFLALVAILAIYKMVDIIASNKDMQIKKLISILLAIILVVPSLASAVPLATVPTYNDGWKEGLDWIATETPDNSVTTCWWDNGHIYTWATRKMVTFDGGSQNSPRAYWVGKAYSTSDEKLATGILRMIATSGDSAFDGSSILMKKTNGSVKETTTILNKILPLNKSSAYAVLTNQYGLTDEETKEVLNLTHPENPNPDYLITYNRMTDIASVWSMFGNWDYGLPADTPNDKREMGFFAKTNGEGYMVNDTLVVKVVSQNDGNYMAMDAILIQNNTMNSYNLVYDLKTQKLVSQKPSQYHKIIIYDGTKIQEKQFNENGTYSLLIRLNPVGNNKYSANAWISSKNLENSVYSKLHFFDGAGLENMALVKASIDPTNQGVQPGFKIYKVDYGTEYLK